MGYVGFSLVFSLLLSALVTNQYNHNWASLSKKWVLLPWTFLTFGISLGSFWAYYELGWGGYWFWDPVENASLMPWIAATALIIYKDIEKLENFLVGLEPISITNIIFLFRNTVVRSGVLNSVHAFANDPERGVYILFIISLINLITLIIYILKVFRQT